MYYITPKEQKQIRRIAEAAVEALSDQIADEFNAGTFGSVEFERQIEIDALIRKAVSVKLSKVDRP